MTDQLQTAPAVPAHDPGTYRRLPARTRPVDPEVVERLLAAEWERFTSWSGASGGAQRAGQQVAAARGHQLVPALGARTRSRSPRPAARGSPTSTATGCSTCRWASAPCSSATSTRTSCEKVTEALTDTGTLFVTPSPQATEMSERFCERFQLDMIRFTNSGTESLMYAIRCARAYTERKAIVKIEGGYHGGYDALQVSVKPGLDEIGPADAPTPQVPVRRRGRHGARHRLQRPRAARPGARRARQRDRRAGRRAGHREPLDRRARRGLPRRGPRGVRRPRRRAHLRRGQDRPHRRATPVRRSGSASPPT